MENGRIKLYRVASGRSVNTENGQHLPFDEIEMDESEGEPLVLSGFLTPIGFIDEEVSDEEVKITSDSGVNISKVD